MSQGLFTSVAVAAITFVLMVVVGSDLDLADFRRMARRPRILLAGLLLPPVLLPPMAMGLVAVVHPPPEVAAGLLLIACCPVGGISNAYVYMARGSTVLSVTLTTLSCLLAFATVPALGTVLGPTLDRPFGIRVPAGGLLLQLVLMVAVPTSIGMLVRTRWPSVAAVWRPRLWPVSVVLLMLLLVVTIAADTDGFLRTLPDALPIGSLFMVGSALAGSAVASALGADWREGVTLAVEFATRNVAVATTIAVTVMGRPEFATFGVAYFLTEVPLMALVVWVVRRHARAGDRVAAAETSALQP